MNTGWVWTEQPGPLMAACLEAAAAAPSVHNSQPWRFRPHQDGVEVGVEVLADRSRQAGLVDPTGRELTISIGAAVFNLRVAMLAHGRVPMLRLLPAPDDPDLLARITVGPVTETDETVRLLARAIPHRRTNRRPFAELPVPPEVSDELVAAARTEHGQLAMVDPMVLDSVLALIRSAEDRRRADPAYWTELERWTRDRPGRLDGVPPQAFGPWPVPRSVPVRDFGLVWPARRRVAAFETEPTLAVLYTVGDGPRDWLRAGQALQRVLLTATVRGLSTTLLTQPLEFPELRDLLGGRDDGRRAQAIVRIGYGPLSPPVPRRPVAELLDPPVGLPVPVGDRRSGGARTGVTSVPERERKRIGSESRSGPPDSRAARQQT
ncbi:nitroreductase family protein [Solwaraspora sp. WMMD406]|uniref:Acg family FMN-binding oxidoreductase n=1 Tax=Solwaraspora sp. WMMD406 TaxID=3016095 RepID=UPI00241755A2|nr:nitroreductase family protein [Solwaraspora sp. WMMD406]MDG4766848.1 nitroreductase family protein [Solwaraspora sp. WMMD406]